jgi:hypothetical protein
MMGISSICVFPLHNSCSFAVWGTLNAPPSCQTTARYRCALKLFGMLVLVIFGAPLIFLDLPHLQSLQRSWADSASNFKSMLDNFISTRLNSGKNLPRPLPASLFLNTIFCICTCLYQSFIHSTFRHQEPSI